MNYAPGYIKIHRSLLDWEWYSDDRCVRLLLHLNLKANYADRRWKGQDLKPGQFITSSVSLSEQLKWSRSAVNRTLDKLRDCGEIATEADSRWTLVTLIKWGQLQGDDENPDSKPDSNRTATGQQTTSQVSKQPDTAKEGKKLRREEGKNLSQLPLPGITVKAPRATYGDSRINDLMDFLKAENGGMLDQSIKANRQACWNLIRKAEGVRPDLDAVTGIKALITRGKAVPFHGPKITSFVYLLAHVTEIKNHIQQPNGKANTIDAKRAALDQLFAEEHAASNGSAGNEHP